jgi:hypothetical protein
MIYILVYSATLLCLASRTEANPDAKRLYENLLANYDRSPACLFPIHLNMKKVLFFKGAHSK